MRAMCFRSSLAACLLVAAFGCATPIPPIEPGSSFAKHPDEWELWQSAEQLDHDLAEANQLSRDTALVAYVGRVAERLIADDLAGTGVELKARVVLDPYRNAFATPNGVVYVNSGLLVALDDEAQLASVLAHEIAHFVHRHSLREKRLRNRNAEVARAGGLLVGVAAAAAGVISVPLMELGEKAVGSSLEVAALGYSRDLEREADQEGFAYLARAGYDLSQGAGVFARLREELVAEGIEEPVFFGTHPRLAEREASYAEMLAASGGGGGERNAEAYASAIRALLPRERPARPRARAARAGSRTGRASPRDRSGEPGRLVLACGAGAPPGRRRGLGPGRAPLPPCPRARAGAPRDAARAGAPPSRPRPPRRREDLVRALPRGGPRRRRSRARRPLPRGNP